MKKTNFEDELILQLNEKILELRKQINSIYVGKMEKEIHKIKLLKLRNILKMIEKETNDT